MLLFEDLSIYIGLVNSANHVTETRKSKNVGASFNHIKELTQGVESSELASAIEKASQIIVNLIEARRKPIFPNLDDLTDIAYTVGVADKKHKSTALLSDIENNEENKRKLIETGNLNIGFFINPVGKACAIITGETEQEDKQQALEQLLALTSDYMNRSIILRRLGEAQSTLINYEFKETDYFLKQIVRGDFSHATAMWGGKRLSSKRRDELSKYFIQQADINAIKFKTLLITINMIIQNPNPVESTEQLYEKLMADYNQWGYVHVNLTRTSSDTNTA